MEVLALTFGGGTTIFCQCFPTTRKPELTLIGNSGNGRDHEHPLWTR